MISLGYFICVCLGKCFFFFSLHNKLKTDIMKKLLLLLLIGFMGCKPVANETDVTSGMTAKKIVETNAYIDFSLNELKDGSRSAQVSLLSSPEFRAGTFRFYKNVSYDSNNIGTCKAKSGKELNMSEELFDLLLNDMENLNRMIRADLEKGIKGIMPAKDEKYFNKLLSE